MLNENRETRKMSNYKRLLVIRHLFDNHFQLIIENDYQDDIINIVS